jgi:predicted nucleic acid-binding protein
MKRATLVVALARNAPALVTAATTRSEVFPRDRSDATKIEGPREHPKLGNVNDEVSDRFGTAKAALERVGTRLEDFDLAVAAHALASGAVLVTANVRHLGRIPGLRIEDWAKG